MASRRIDLTDTIYALSSGRPPAAIAIVRISGPRAAPTLSRLAGGLPPPRLAALRELRDAAGDLLDRGLVLWFPGPETATGEDLAELHLHGGVAVVNAVLRALAVPGLRMAEPGEFTRRAFMNGRLDGAEVEGLADLLAAETETQRREALLRTSGALGRQLGEWRERVTACAAVVEAAIDYDDIDEVKVGLPIVEIAALCDELRRALVAPHRERLRDGIRVAIVGPVNAGKSTLFNALIGHDAAITSAVPGTTRDVVERPVAIGGLPFLLADTAGLRQTDDAIEAIGIERARIAAQAADIIIDLGDQAPDEPRRLRIAAKSDLGTGRDGLPVSAQTGAGIDTLLTRLVQIATGLLPATDEITWDRRQRSSLASAVDALDAARDEDDLVLIAEHLAAARIALDGIVGLEGVDGLLDAMFARFCLGK